MQKKCHVKNNREIVTGPILGQSAVTRRFLGLQMSNMSIVSTFWNQVFVLAVLFSPDAVRSRGCVQAGWCRWQQAGLGLHSQMGDDRELLPALTHLPHHLCWEGDQLHTKPQDLAAWLDSFSGSQTALSKHPGMWECSALNQTSAPCWESSRWSWGL